MRRTTLAGLALACSAALAGPGLARAGDGFPPGGTYGATFENDLFAGTDRDYTNGVRADYRSPAGALPLWGRFLRRHSEGLTDAEDWAVTYGLGHQIYTPEDISLAVPEPGDRPYAGFAFVSAGIVATGARTSDALTLDLGLVGPATQAEEIQSFVHDVVNAQEPNGWDTQIRNEPAFRLAWRRAWAPLARAGFAGIGADLSPLGEIALGNVDTSASVGLVARIGNDLPAVVDVAPIEAIEAGDGLVWSLFASAEGRLVGYDIFLQGNAFRDGVDGVTPNRLVGDFALGLSLGYGPVALVFESHVVTQEFDAQSGGAQFGSVNLRYRF